MEQLGFLDDPLPIMVLGYSYGTMLAYQCVQSLEHDYQLANRHFPKQKKIHFTSLGGPDRTTYHRWTFLPSEDRSLESFVNYHIANMGRMNPFFDMDTIYVPKLLAVILEVFHRDNAMAQPWLAYFDHLSPNRRILQQTSMTSIIGADDIAVRKDGWKDLAQGGYEEFVVPGDHFFVYHNEDFDRDVVQTMQSSFLRALEQHN
jgi:surfactin synthase thioesterase subunit